MQLEQRGQSEQPDLLVCKASQALQERLGLVLPESPEPLARLDQPELLAMQGQPASRALLAQE